MTKYKTHDGVEVKATLVKGRTEKVVRTDDDDSQYEDEVTHHDFWEVTFPDGTVKEVIDTNPVSGEKVFAAQFKEVK